MGNDVTILLAILVFLVGLGLIAPLIQEATGYQAEYNTDNLPTLGTPAAPNNSIWYPGEIGGSADVWHVAGNIFIAIAWVFTWMPAWLIAFHVIIRLILIVIVYRLLRSGSG